MLSNILMNFALVGWWLWQDWPGAHAALALSSALAGYINAGLLYWALRREGIYTPLPGWGRKLAILGGASVVMTAVLIWQAVGFAAWAAGGASERITGLTIAIAAGAISYLALCLALGLRPRHLLDRNAG
jgi:putative peptidoglycan lipid II flippase